MGLTYLQYGCSWDGVDGWLNFDASPTLRFERIPVIGKFYSRNSRRFPANVRYGDIVKGLPIPDNSCAGIYASHILEHLALEDFERAIANTFRYLAPGGRLRLIVPDLEIMTRVYLADRNDTAAIAFIESSGLGRQRRSRSLMGMAVEMLGNSAHLWMWDYKSITTRLSAHGFVDMRRAQFGDSEDPRFAEVEHADRFVGCVGVECRK